MNTLVQLDHTEVWKFNSSLMDYTYEIRVYVPNVEPPKEGFPVSYMLDGGSYFQFGMDTVRLQSRNAPKTDMSEAIVIGICHCGTAEEIGLRRFYDFTPPADSYQYPDRFKGAKLGKHGGAEKLLHFIKGELMTEIALKYQVNPQRQALFGHSLGGLFVLWSLFKEPQLFDTYLAISPSIWWNNDELFSYANRFLAEEENHEQTLFIGVGGKEGFMVKDAQELYSLFKEKSNLNSSFYIAEDENHASVVPTVISRAFRCFNM